MPPCFPFVSPRNFLRLRKTFQRPCVFPIPNSEKEKLVEKFKRNKVSDLTYHCYCAES